MKICFQMPADNTWLFGRVYFQDLFYVLQKTQGDRVHLCVLSSNSWLTQEDWSVKVDVLAYSLPARWTKLWLFDHLILRLLRSDLRQAFFLKRQGVDLLLCWQVPVGLGFPTLALIPDFQHIHLPDMFSQEERQARDHSYLDTAQRATRIIVWSQSVKRDFEAFAPQFAGKVKVIHPVSVIPDSVYQDDPRQVSEYYHLPDKFVYLPNQYWKHKNHKVVFRALRLLKEKGINVFLVCSGYPNDTRHPMYFSELLTEITTLGIWDQVVLLGSLSRDHVLRLMRQSICVLTPSLFEGYGMTVEEARSLGKQLLISDIPPHREQNPPATTYFDPNDSHDLAMKLGRIWHAASPGPDVKLETEARASLARRIVEYAESFMSVIWETVVSVHRT